VPLDLETICLTAISKRPLDRYSNCREFAEDMRRWLAGEPIRARPLGPVERLLRWCAREPVVTIAVILVVACLAAFGIFSDISNRNMAAAKEDAERALHQAEQSQRQAEQARRTAEMSRQAETDARQKEKELQARSETAERESKEHAQSEAAARATLPTAMYASRISLATREWESGEFARARQLLDACKPDSGKPDLRRWEWDYLRRQCRAEVITLRCAAKFKYPTFSADGIYLAALE
jgi:type II secretory pathway pseudopilin PulG